MNDKNMIKRGCVDIRIDDLTQCLIDTRTSEEVETFVFKIETRSQLKRFRENNGWRINWYEIPEDVSVYALALSPDETSNKFEIEGLVGIKDDKAAHAVYVHWAVAAPHNNPYDFGAQKYKGVGGHLFAIAAEKSIDFGYGGFLHAYALNKDLLEHYCKTLGAIYIGAQHEFQFIIDEEQAHKLLEVYTYDWKTS